MRPSKLVDFEGIARHQIANIMLYEPKDYSVEICLLKESLLSISTPSNLTMVIRVNHSLVYIERIRLFHFIVSLNNDCLKFVRIDNHFV